MTAYRLLALDMDGTLLTDDKQITEEARHWIRLAEEAGVKVIFATGRGMQTAGSFWDELGLQSPMVLLNGAEIWEGPGRLHERVYISRDDIRRLHRLAVEAGESFWGYSVERLTSSRRWDEEMFNRDWMKFGIRHDDLAVIGRLRDEVRSWGCLEITRSADINMEISPLGISKASGVKKVCELLGITMETQEQVRILELPFDISSYSVKQHWHDRFHADPGNVWLRRTVAELFLDMSS